MFDWNHEIKYKSTEWKRINNKIKECLAYKYKIYDSCHGTEKNR